MGLLGIWKAVPLGFAIGIAPFKIFFATISGALTSALIIYFFGDWVRKVLKNRFNRKPSKRNSRANQLLQKYGTMGLGFLGTLIIGPNATLLVGLLLVESAKKLLLWTVIGIICWSFVLTWLTAGGIEIFQSF